MSMFQGAHDFAIGSMNVTQSNSFYNGSKSPLERLEENYVAGASHDSQERCDAPKCMPETRTAVQQEITSWVDQAGNISDDPRKILWMSGPAGTGKTAIAGTIADACQEKGILAGAFFFSSLATSVNRRLNKGLVATLAYQLRLHPVLGPVVADGILASIERDPAIFKKRLANQLEELILKPLADAQEQLSSLQGAPKVIIIDGLDECDAELHEQTRNGKPISEQEKKRLREMAQVEVLSLIVQAAKSPIFPFRILIASRPEHSIKSFFEENAQYTAPDIFLDSKYDPDSDIRLYLNAKFSAIRRRYGLPASWPREEAINRLVKMASGQFIYAATAIRFIEDAHPNPPQAQLEQVLSLKASTTSNPFDTLDALYTHILHQSPNPRRSVQWLLSIEYYLTLRLKGVADSVPFEPLPSLFCRQFLEVSPGEAAHLLGCLHSLVAIPSSDDSISPYKFYHKSLFDFLASSTRCPEELHCRSEELYEERWIDILITKGPKVPLATQADIDSFLSNFLLLKPCFQNTDVDDTYRDFDQDWWADLICKQDKKVLGQIIETYFRGVHHACLMKIHVTRKLLRGIRRCPRVCKSWRKVLVQRAKDEGFDTPSQFELFMGRHSTDDPTLTGLVGNMGYAILELSDRRYEPEEA